MVPDEVAEIRRVLVQHEKRISDLENIFKSKPKDIKKEQSIKEFILEKQPKTDVDKTLAIAYYLEHFREYATFNVEDLTNGLREAKENMPKNINLAVIGNISRGNMMEAKEKKNDKKAWTLTNSGVRFVENGLKEEEK